MIAELLRLAQRPLHWLHMRAHCALWDYAYDGVDYNVALRRRGRVGGLLLFVEADFEDAYLRVGRLAYRCEQRAERTWGFPQLRPVNDEIPF